MKHLSNRQEHDPDKHHRKPQRKQRSDPELFRAICGKQDPTGCCQNDGKEQGVVDACVKANRIGQRRFNGCESCGVASVSSDDIPDPQHWPDGNQLNDFQLVQSERQPRHHHGADCR